MNHQTSIRFPITLRWEDGKLEEYGSALDLACNLEDFSNLHDPKVQVTDAAGQNMLLILSCTRLLTLMPMPEQKRESSLIRWSDGATVSHATLMAETANGGCNLGCWLLAVGGAWIASLAFN